MGEGEQKNRLVRFRELFEQLVELPEKDHKAFLDEHCPEDKEMRRELLSLVLQTQSAGRDIEQIGKVAIAAGRRTIESEFREESEQPGTKIGNFTIVELLGEGGFGSVWKAEQSEPVRRMVALKIIKLGMDTKEVVARFEAERQALAMMDHPNIATVFDAGATETGRPYFVMELVQGIPITNYCNENQLNLEQRLRLFIDVCHAVQHAHQTGVIHRDIKPSNILVSKHDDQPVPKIIDFGIAKATSRQLTDQTFVTQLHTFVGTPVYSSPEQMDTSGQYVDTRTDIYSLGVVLYELLTGQVPFDPDALARHGLEAMYRILRENDPPKPSTRLKTLSDADRSTVARQLGTKGSDLANSIKGDLDAIVMHCIERDRSRRYGTANSLAEDLARFLAHQPISARPPTKGYLIRKFLERHHRMVASLVAMTLILIIGTATSVWQAVRATKAEQQAVIAKDKETAARKSAEATLFTYNAQELLDNERASNTDALAHAIASLEREDTPERRLLALNALWKAPLYFRMDTVNGHKPCEGAQFTHNGKWLITGSSGPEILMWPSDGGNPVSLSSGDSEFIPVGMMKLSPSGKFLLVHYQQKDAVPNAGPFKQIIWDMEKLTIYREWTVDDWAPNWFHPDDSKLLAYSLVEELPYAGMAWWSIDDQTISPLGSPHLSPPPDLRLPPVQLHPFFYSPSEDMKWLVSWQNQDIYVTPIGDSSLGEPVLMGNMEDHIKVASINRDGSLVSSADERQLSVWSRTQPGTEVLKLQTSEASGIFDVWESHIIAGNPNFAYWAYDLKGPIGSGYIPLYPFGRASTQITMHPEGKWLAAPTSYDDFGTSPDNKTYPPISIYNLNEVRPYRIETGVDDEMETANGVKLFPDLSKAFIPTADGRLYLVDLTSPALPRSVFFETPGRKYIINGIFDPMNEYILIGTFKENAWLIPLDGGSPIHLEEAPKFTFTMAFSPSGNFIAVAGGPVDIPQDERYARILDRQGNLIARLEGFDDEMINYFAFLNEYELLISSDTSLKRWNFQQNQTDVIKSGPNYDISTSKNYVLANSEDSLDLYDRVTLERKDISFTLPAPKVATSLLNFTSIAPNEEFIISRDKDRNFLIQYLGEERYHLIPNKSFYTGDIFIDPNGYWFAAINYSGVVTYWPIPRGEPLHDRPIDEFLSILKAQTNVRAVVDPEDERGYRYEIEPFPGWETNNSWQEWYSPEYMENTPWKPMLDLKALGINSK